MIAMLLSVMLLLLPAADAGAAPLCGCRTKAYGDYFRYLVTLDAQVIEESKDSYSSPVDAIRECRKRVQSIVACSPKAEGN